MTDARRVARVPQASTTAAGASVLFLGALGVLGVQLARGHDPALGAGRPQAAAARPGTPRPIIEKHIVRRVVVTKVITDPVAAPAAPVRPAPARLAATSSAPVVRTTAPPVATAPAPAPAPAPVQTRTS